MATFINRTVPAQTYYRQTQTYYQQRPAPDVRDDYERWYTENSPNNRMSLSIRSGIDTEVGWALDRLCRLVRNELFVFSAIPGIIDGLFDWPEWYVTEGHKQVTHRALLFSEKPEFSRRHRFALESLFVLRNAALHEPNARELALHPHTIPLIMDALHNLDHSKDENAEPLLHIMDIFQVIAAHYPIDQYRAFRRSNPVPPLLKIASESNNRTMIISSLSVLTALFSNPGNSTHLTPNSPALSTSIRCLPLFNDKPLIDACLNYMYIHLSLPAMARAFLLQPEMPGVLKVLTSLLLHEQHPLQKPMSLDVTGPIHIIPSTTQPTRDHELTKEELEGLVSKPEPQRCFDWMKLMFVAKPEGELTQVDFWNLYRDAFTPYADLYPLLVASDVIKNVTQVFPIAQAMVLQEPVQRFIVRGVDRRKDPAVVERFKCSWDRSQCNAQSFDTPGSLYDHLLQHLAQNDASELPCLWSSCSHPATSKHRLSSHILTHLSSLQPPQKHPSQSDTITLPHKDAPYPVPDPTNRPLPPPRHTVITYEVPIADPPTTSLTALLIIRILFRTSFASAEVAPRADADHFGFPGVVEEPEEPDGSEAADGALTGDEHEGEKRGRKAFVGIRKLLDGVKIHDDVLMSWILEMADASISNPGE
ncbi:hypothetical protein CVT24_005349 [Panaeolus cyanescens]|uniref:RFX-type winged-helix domain-containing protein n=1 Tax=Panaeolus cyanescens TaxID=181874 RepID=A0A409Y9L5_9AGAR|nr:hypothetical protein CVT24_005349 [Panaeolus cyanescens]